MKEKELTEDKQLALLEKIASRPLADVELLDDPAPELLQESLQFLQSDKARTMLERDPYWPKWDGPWWHMMVLHELGLTKLIPQERIEQVLEAFRGYYLHYFPFKLEDVPAGKNPLNQIICHCQMGCIEQLLTAYGINFKEQFPWASDWYEKHQLPDGGLNCDEAAYTKKSPKSSIVSTLPALEAVLQSPLLGADAIHKLNFLERGASYLIVRKLLRSATTGAVINDSWTQLCFPRFYFYDVLRGVSFLLNWSLRLDRAIPASAICESMEIIDSQNPSDFISLGRVSWKDSFTRDWDPATSNWVRKPESSYPLLDSLSTIGHQSKPLTQEWNRAKTTLRLLLEKKLISP